jgi:citrate synthase
MIDLDVPRNDTVLPLLHWYQPDLTIKDKKSRVLSVHHWSKQQRAKYIAPSPPPGSAHRYVQILFEQPGDFSFPREFEKYLDKKSEARLGFEIKEFINAAGLGEPVAGNWFLVQTSEKERDDL